MANPSFLNIGSMGASVNTDVPELTLDEAIAIVNSIALNGEWEPNLLLRQKAIAIVLMYVQGAFPR